MKPEAVNTAQGTGICGNSARYAKLKVEKENLASNNGHEISAGPNPAQALQGHDGMNAHLYDADGHLRMPDTWVGKEVSAVNDTNGDLESLSLSLADEGKPSVEIDVAKYQAYLDDPSLSEDQKEDIIKALWSIMVAFVDLGFGVHPAQEVCGKPASKLDVAGDKDSNESKPVDSLSKAFERASDDT